MVDQDIGLGSAEVSDMEVRLRVSRTYALEIPVDHPLVMNVDQPPRDIPQLKDFVIINKARTQRFSIKTYKPEPVNIRMCLHEIVDIPMYHPF